LTSLGMSLQTLGTGQEIVHELFAQASASKANTPALVSTPWRRGLWRSRRASRVKVCGAALWWCGAFAALSPSYPRRFPFCPLLRSDLFGIPWVFLYSTLLVCPPAIVEVMVSLATAARIWTKAPWTRAPSGLAPRRPRRRGWPSAAPPPLGDDLRSF